MKKKPNIVFVLTDDQGYGDLACHGNPWLHTPNIDQFYCESVRLTNFHVGPTCAPTRSGLMTGHYANSTGVWHTIGGRSLLREDEWTIASALRENGYRTGLFGKWHLGDNYPYRPEDRGFDEVVVHGGGGISQTPDYWGNDYFDDTYRVNGKYKKFSGYCTDVFFEEAMTFIKDNAAKQQSFFCCLATNAPHAPYNVEDKYADLYRGKVRENRARFYGMISNLDENFGKLRNLIKKEGLDDNTILIFMTDNGSSCSLTYDKEGNVIEGYNANLRGMKGSPYDGGHRVPFFIRYRNGKIEGGRDVDGLCANVDFMPTLLDLCGIEYDEGKFHGKTLKKSLVEGIGQYCDRKIVTDSQRVPIPIKWRKSCVMKGEWRLINGRELYNMETDWTQSKDISEEYPELTEELREAYEEWWKMVSVKFDAPIPIHLQGETQLNAHDWRGDIDECVWNQGLIREGKMTQGHWEISVKEEREYEICLYRWAPETNYGLNAGIEGNDTGYDRKRTQKEYWKYYENGVAIKICQALIYLDDKLIAEDNCLDGRTACKAFHCILPEGIHTLKAVFGNKEGEKLGAYYVVVR